MCKGGEMEIGEVSTASIDSRPLWNRTGIRLQAGQQYQLGACGEWIDKEYKCGPSGYPSPKLFMKWLEWLRRAPKQNWFALMGALDCDEKNLFYIGDSLTFAPGRSGELTCFANDLRATYFNNHGSVQLTVKRLR